MAVFVLGSVIPTLIYVTLLWWLDKYEKEPWGLYLGAFAYGCIPAIIFSVILELPFSRLGDMLRSGIVAPIIEECVKGAAILLIFLIWRREFDDVLDGIVYGAVIGFGFAMVENFLYVLSTSSMGVLALRVAPFGMNHAVFTAFAGAGLGLARQSKRRWLWLLLFPLALMVGITFHTIHNLTVNQGCLGMAFALTSDWGGVIVLVVVALFCWRQERHWIRQELGEEVASGLLAEADQQAMLSLSRRVGARLWMWRRYGWRAFHLLGRYFNLATELAFRKHYLRAGTEGPRWARDVEVLREQVRQTRAALLALRGTS